MLEKIKSGLYSYGRMKIKKEYSYWFVYDASTLLQEVQFLADTLKECRAWLDEWYDDSENQCEVI